MMAGVDSNIKAGSKVQLTIGGPEMLVEVVDQDGIVYCVWFNQIGDLQKDRFQKEALELISKRNN